VRRKATIEDLRVSCGSSVRGLHSLVVRSGRKNCGFTIFILTGGGHSAGAGWGGIEDEQDNHSWKKSKKIAHEFCHLAKNNLRIIQP
jgi:hypothetical protein